ncbi:MAG: VWA domain-containing protein [Acidimicrobiia bacterium]|nr:VWA domain-containing protein [Acidimicrobiia bacterium]
MSFERWWVLLLTPAPLIWLFWGLRKYGLRIGFLLKALALFCVLLALAEPVLPTWETKVAVVYLADTSASLTEADLHRASAIAGSLENQRGRHWLRVAPFARQTRELTPAEMAGELMLQPTAGEAGRISDLEAAVREAAGSLPAGMVPRLVLATDGRENRGSLVRAAYQASLLGIPIDTFLLQGKPRPALRLEAVRLPSLVFSGERFAMDLEVASPAPVTATVSLMAEGRMLGESQAPLEAGMNLVRLHASVGSQGAIELSGSLRADGYGEASFARAVSLRKPRLLYVSQDPPGTETHLIRALAAAQFEIQQRTQLGDGRLDEFQIAVLNNLDLESIPPARKADLENFTQQGGGLLVIGGERNIYAENKQIEDALDRALPAKLAPPRSPEGTCVVLIIDKSSSMEGKKMQLARLAAIGVVDNLRPIDMVGVLIFDNSFQWAIPIRRTEDKGQMKRLVAGITPDGGTQIAPALSESYRRIVSMPATFKHIVLLTDGISEEGDSIALSKEAAGQKVTISTVGLGQDVNRAYLEKVASFAKGKSYFLSDPVGLEQILLRDVLEHTGSTAVERPISPKVVKQAEILDKVGMETAPPLKGYVRFIAKPSAETLLSMDGKDPLLTRWQFGLGRSAVFASDAKSRWAADWVGWPGYDKFWANLLRDLLPHTQPAQASLDFDSSTGELIAGYKLGRQFPEPARPPDIFVIGPDGFRKPVELRKLAQGTYRGTVEIGDRRGLFRVRPLEESRAFPEIGYYRQEPELSEFGADEPLLRRVSEFTGGRFQPSIAGVFDAGGRAIPTSMNLWPGLLALAILLSLAELVHRKWNGVMEWMRAFRGR